MRCLPRWLGQLGRGLRLSLAVLLLGALAAEIARRATGRATRQAANPRYLFVADPELGVRLRPGYSGLHRHTEFSVPLRISQQGFRDDELGPKAPGELRILFLSDSFGYG